MKKVDVALWGGPWKALQGTDYEWLAIVNALLHSAAVLEKDAAVERMNAIPARADYLNSLAAHARSLADTITKETK